MTTAEEIHARATELRGYHPEWRYGQALFNAAMEICPERAVKVIGSTIDPFHDDSMASYFLGAMAGETP